MSEGGGAVFTEKQPRGKATKQRWLYEAPNKHLSTKRVNAHTKITITTRCVGYFIIVDVELALK